MKVKFPQTLKAVQAVEKSQWQIGDALVREAKADYHGDRGIAAVVAELEAHDLNYSAQYLGQLRQTAEDFPRSRRLDLPWKVHAEAGNPDTLDVIVKAARKDGKKVTIWYVSDVLRALREEARREHEKEQAAARKEAERAAEIEAQAKEDERVADTPTTRERAKAKRLEATERRRKAQEQVKARKSPRRKDAKPPDEDKVGLLHAAASTKSNANQARRLGEESKKLLKHTAADLPPGIAAGLIDAALRVANTWREVADHVRTSASKAGSHLSVVNE